MARQFQRHGSSAAVTIDGRSARGTSRQRFHRATVILGIVIGVAWGGRATPAQHLADLSDDLVRWQTHPTSDRVRVIVPGTREDLQTLLIAHPLPVVRWL